MKNEELDAMMKEASGPINFTVFLTMFGEKLKGESNVLGPSSQLPLPDLSGTDLSGTLQISYAL